MSSCLDFVVRCTFICLTAQLQNYTMTTTTTTTIMTGQLGRCNISNCNVSSSAEVHTARDSARHQLTDKRCVCSSDSEGWPAHQVTSLYSSEIDERSSNYVEHVRRVLHSTSTCTVLARRQHGVMSSLNDQRAYKPPSAAYRLFVNDCTACEAMQHWNTEQQDPALSFTHLSCFVAVLLQFSVATDCGTPGVNSYRLTRSADIHETVHVTSWQTNLTNL